MRLEVGAVIALPRLVAVHVKPSECFATAVPLIDPVTSPSCTAGHAGHPIDLRFLSVANELALRGLVHTEEDLLAPTVDMLTDACPLAPL